MSAFDFDEDAMIAAIELAHRSGATDAEFGHLDDDVPIEQARWWAKAQYKGARIQTENHRGPVEALEALARRILKGGHCTGCGRRIILSSIPMEIGSCRWTREGRHWLPKCPGRNTMLERIREREAQA